MTGFKEGDIIKCNYTDSEHFSEREILHNKYKNLDIYVTRFIEDDSIVQDSKKVIDKLYQLK